ncbi:unnamed protein product [Gongylonema pulchrum]|uniref:DNA-directed DNA polymerase n=1 Tax=Gongylonema pulchrum TaxID=637853 RepID=A0A183DLG6_9BILA|nr:unnamed protein product [Gongylonema pulchrum]
MLGGRAERNEYLLLHAFHRAGYVAPNKYQTDFKRNKKVFDTENDAATAEKDGNSRPLRTRKAQYVGGLVLEPKIGIHFR